VQLYKRYEAIEGSGKGIHQQISAIKEMQIKTSLRFHLTPVRMTIIKKINDKKC
jgi:hypothetical protein